MSRVVSTVILLIITSFYLFPFEFTFLRGVNTKMAMAAIGLVWLVCLLAMERGATVRRDFFKLSLWALGVSLVSFLATVYNGTRDYTYVTYIVSMWVWTGAAYVVVSLLRRVHGGASVFLVCNYLIAVCSIQCVLALMIDSIPALKAWVDQNVASLGFADIDKMKDINRLYGIGAGLDVAGSRFSAVLLMIAYWCVRLKNTLYRSYLGWYIGAFFLIGIVGNMISRTTSVGLVFALLYWVYATDIIRLKLRDNMRKVWGWIIGGLLLLIPGIVYFYNVNEDFHENLRFAFEGFFSLAETGTWDVHSNNVLMNMYVFPDNLKTWIIGDGYFDNPTTLDPYYVGPQWLGFYHDTDVGYLRFIYYFGLSGLLMFMLFMGQVAQTCGNALRSSRVLFMAMLLLNYIVWLKVSTDIFVVFALFLCINEEEQTKSDKLMYVNS